MFVLLTDSCEAEIFEIWFYKGTYELRRKLINLDF